MATTQEILSGLLGAGGSLAAAYLPYEATSGEMTALKDIVSGFKTDVGTLSDQLTGVSQFKPFTVTTPTGTTDVAEGGGLWNAIRTSSRSNSNRSLRLCSDCCRCLRWLSSRCLRTTTDCSCRC